MDGSDIEKSCLITDGSNGLNPSPSQLNIIKIYFPKYQHYKYFIAFEDDISSYFKSKVAL